MADTSLIYLVSFVLRIVVLVLLVMVGIELWQARRADGPLVHRFAIFFVFNAIGVVWYLIATMLAMTGAAPWLRPIMWEWAAVAWGPLAVALFLLWRTLRRWEPRR